MCNKLRIVAASIDKKKCDYGIYLSVIDNVILPGGCCKVI